jgi:hypothetical protein
MSCSLLTSGWAKGCKDNAGGLKRVLIANTIDVVSFTEGTTGSLATPTGEITAITMDAGAVFYEFVPNKMSSNWVENIQSNAQNGTIGYEQVLTMIFAKNEAAARNRVSLLGQSEVYIIVEDYNGKYFLLGEFNGCELTGGSSSSGTALSDLNGWTLTFTAMEPDPAKEVNADIIAALLA